MAYDFDPDKFLDIAKELLKERGEDWNVTKVTTKLKVSGRDVGTVGKLIKAGLIETDPDTGEVDYTVPLDGIEEFLEDISDKKKVKSKGRKTVAKSAEDAVDDVLRVEVATEARDRTSNYLAVGKAVAHAAWKYFQAMGIPMDEATKYPIHLMVPEALDYLARAEQLERQNKALLESQRVLAMHVDPVVRLKTATGFLMRFMEFAILGKAMGLDLQNSPAVQYYETLINGILTGDLQPAITKMKQRRKVQS